MHPPEDNTITAVPAAGASELSPQDAHATLGRYRPVYELASGGMATVFLAVTEGAEGFDKIVALKRVHPHLARQTGYVEMFLDEARIAARLTHPNVCSVFDFGQVDGTFFMAMEYLLGESLSQMLRRLSDHGGVWERPGFVALACRMVIDAAEGLHAAHELKDEQGRSLDVVHRDVSPQNLHVGYDGVVRVLDFGIATARDKLHQTETGEFKGKFAYTSPEQLNRASVDRRTDVFALGVVLWELLTLRRLFKRDTEVQTLAAIAECAVPPPSEIRDDVPRELDRLVLRALAPQPEDRYPTARELSRALHRFINKRSLEPVTSAELAELMRELFPDGESNKRQLMTLARSRRAIPRAPGTQEDSDSVSLRGRLSELPTRKTHTPPPGVERRRILRAGLWLGGLGALAAAGGVVFGWTSGGEDAPRPRAGPDDERAPGDGAPSGAGAQLSADDERASDAGPMESGAGASGAGASGAGTSGSPDAGPPAAGSSDAGTSDEGPPRRRSGRRGGGRRRGSRDAGAPPSAGSAERPGTLVVVGGARWAAVFIDGRPAGNTPLRRALAPGRYRVEMRVEGQPPPIVRQVTISAGQTTRLRAEGR